MNQVIEKSTPLNHIKTTPWSLGYHPQSQTGWINDPNDLCFHQGRFHVLFQHSPDLSSTRVAQYHVVRQ